MQQVLDVLGQSGGIESMAREFGISESQAASGAAALIPAVLGGFKKQAQAQPAGLGGLIAMLGGLGGGGLMDEVLAPRPTNVAPGNDILGQIFGSKDISRTVAKDAAVRTGLDSSLLKKMLPVLAMLVAGYMAKKGRSSGASPGAGGLGDVLGGLLGGDKEEGARGSSLGGLASMLDLNGNGNPLDDILGMGRKNTR